MADSVAKKLLASHLVSGSLEAGTEIGIRIDQTLTQDATGTLVMLELEAMGLDRVQTEVSAQYVDHNLIQADYKNPDDHLFLRSACQRFGLWYSRPGGGVSHPLHQQHFGAPGKTLLGSDSHSCAAGAIGMLAIGAGGMDVAMAMAGEPFHLPCPRIFGVELVGELPEWVSAKDVILEMLRRHGVTGGLGKIIEYHGPGLAGLSAMDRHVIANMGAELGATSTVFPSDDQTHSFLRAHGREADWSELGADSDADYDERDRIDLSELEPLIAMPSSPGNVEKVRDVAGEEIYQAYIGSSANPGYRDFAVAAHIVDGRHAHNRVSLDINPSSRRVLEGLVAGGQLGRLIQAGARIHQAGCNGCIGMGQAPATGKISLRTVPRNFPGRSGTREDRVCLVSPETAAASALTGVITDPRTLDMDYPRIEEPSAPVSTDDLLVPPIPAEDARQVELERGPNISPLPRFDPLPNRLELPVLLVMGDDISTDEILPAGLEVLPLRSNIEAISEFAFSGVEKGYAERARETRDRDGHAVIAGKNYGQGSSREHAALAPRYLGLRVVLAREFARIHRQNLVNFGVLPLELADPDSELEIRVGDHLRVEELRQQLTDADEIQINDRARDRTIHAVHRLSQRQVDVLLAGGLAPYMRDRLTSSHSAPRAEKSSNGPQRNES